MPEKSALDWKVATALAIPVLLTACATYAERDPQLDWELTAPQTAQQSATYYTVHVRPGDTLSQIAQRYAVSTASVARLNSIGDHDSIYTGQTLRIPAGSRATRDAVFADATSQPSHSNPYVPAPQPRRGGYLTSAPSASAASAPAVVARRSPAPAWYKPSTQQTSPVAKAAPPQTQPDVQLAQNVPGSPRFSWPVSGRILSDFGATSSGERNDGINIAARSGEPIHAAAAGTVTYAGNQLRNYGNLLFIRHDDGYVTAYAHAQNIVVQKGDRVLKGQVVAYVGQTGDVSQPQLHFEIRRDLQPVNPRPLLVASR